MRGPVHAQALTIFQTNDIPLDHYFFFLLKRFHAISFCVSYKVLKYTSNDQQCLYMYICRDPLQKYVTGFRHSQYMAKHIFYQNSYQWYRGILRIFFKNSTVNTLIKVITLWYYESFDSIPFQRLWFFLFFMKGYIISFTFLSL